MSNAPTGDHAFIRRPLDTSSHYWQADSVAFSRKVNQLELPFYTIELARSMVR